MRSAQPQVSTLFVGLLGCFVSAILYFVLPSSLTVFSLVGLLASVILVAGSGFVASWSIVFIGATFNGVSIQIGGFAVRPEHLTIFVFLIMLHHMRTVLPKLASKLSVPLVCFGSAFIIWNIVISMGSPSPMASLWIVMQYALGIVWLVPFLVYPAGKRPLVKSGTLIFAGVTLVSLIAYAAQVLGAQGLPGVSPTSGRLQGFSFEPNIYASQAAVWLGVMYFWRRSLGSLEKVAGAAIAVGVLLAGTRSAWLALLAIGALALFNMVKRGSPWSVALGGLLGIAGIAAPFLISMLASVGILGREITHRLQNLLESDSGTGAYRIDNFGVAFTDLDYLDAWWTGLGANSFSQYHSMDATGVGAAYLGSLWITLVYDSGFIGLMLFVGLFFAIWRHADHHDENFAVFAAIAICAAFTNFLWFQYAWLSIALVSGKSDESLAFTRAAINLDSKVLNGGQRF